MADLRAAPWSAALPGDHRESVCVTCCRIVPLRVTGAACVAALCAGQLRVARPPL